MLHKKYLCNCSLSETEEEDTSSDTDVSENINIERHTVSTSNTPPVLERPPFRKYGVNDFRYLKVI